MDATARQTAAERNRTFVRDLLAVRQPAFAAALESAVTGLEAGEEVTAP